MQDTKVRKAINMAIDKQGMVHRSMPARRGSSRACWRPAPSPTTRTSSFYEYDPERAKQLLAEAGYPDGI